MAAGESGGFPWGRAAIALAPAAALVAAVPAVGGGVAAFALIGAAVVAHGLALTRWLPRLTSVAAAPSEADAVVTEFLQRALEAGTIEDVAEELVATVRQGLGTSRAILLAPSATGAVRVLPEGATGEAEIALDDAQTAFMWLGEASEPLYRERLVGLPGEGAAASRALLERFGGEVLLPLRHRGLLLGLGVVGPPPVPVPRADAFLRALRAYAAVAIANTYLDAETRGRKDLVADMTLANAVQESLMPAERPVRRERYSLRGVFRPMADCGGDLWMWRELAGEKLLLVIADATGHGPGPALLAAVAKGAIDAQWQMFSGELDPAQVLRATNRLIHRVGRQAYFMTAFAAVIDTVSGEMTFANAGQNFPFVMTRTGVDTLIARGNALGAAAEATYQTHRRKLEQGDRLVLFTDGVVEAQSRSREAFGERRFRSLLASYADVPAYQLPELVLKRIEEHVDGRALDDDVTAVVFELGPGGMA